MTEMSYEEKLKKIVIICMDLQKKICEDSNPALVKSVDVALKALAEGLDNSKKAIETPNDGLTSGFTGATALRGKF